MKQHFVFIGSYSKSLLQGTGEIVEGRGEGITVLRLNAEDGTMTCLHAYPEIVNPTYLAVDPDGGTLYCVNEVEETDGLQTSTVSAYRIDPRTGALTFLNRRITGGTDACHVLINREGTYAFAANFMSGSVCVLPICSDGSLGPASCFLQHCGSGPNPIRQTGPHAHGCTLDHAERRLLVPDLGTDEIMIYDVDWQKGHLRELVPPARTAAGEGPRHCVMGPDGTRIYLINEMGSSICVYSYDLTSGSTELLQRVSTLPESFSGHSTCAAIRIHPNGRFIYGSNRGHDSIAVFRIAADGLLEPVEIVPSGGEIPRDFALTPDGAFLLAVNQTGNNVTVFRVDSENGSLKPVGRQDGICTGTTVAIL